MPELKPVGQRPKCLYCGTELRPQFNRESPPLNVATGGLFKVRTQASYGTGKPEYEDAPEYRPLTDAEKKQFRKDHPPQFLAYGDYRDNRFCGLRCGYHWAVAHSRPQDREAEYPYNQRILSGQPQK